MHKLSSGSGAVFMRTTSALVVGIVLLCVATLDAAPSSPRLLMAPSYYSDSLSNEESQRLGILEMLAQLGQNMIRDDLENSKRGLGFGMDRGYSAQRAAQHLMGLHAATWPGGPGRRRRSEGEEMKRMGIGMGMDRGYSGNRAAQYLIGMDAANRIGKRMDNSAGEPEE